MLKFKFNLVIRERVLAKCNRHPRYNPEKDGRAGIKSGCLACWDLYNLHEARLKLEAAVHTFTRRAGPWAAPRRSRKITKSADAADAEIDTKNEQNGMGLEASCILDENGSGYDYQNQAWIQEFKYLRCGHVDEMNCNCYGKLHEGESVPRNRPHTFVFTEPPSDS